jgi:F-type H+-transporting ATPase subunit epsilon
MTTVSQQKQRFFLAGGFVEVEGDEIRVLADVVEEAEEIDVDRAKASHDRAVDRLDEQHEETDVERANKALKRAKIRMMVAETLAAVTK